MKIHRATVEPWRALARAVSLALLALALWAPRAEASTTRIYTLGAMNRFILDDSNRWLYPHVITRYDGLFYLELFGGAASANATAPGSRRAISPARAIDLADTVPVQQSAGGGAILGLSEDLVVALHLSDYEDPAVPRMLDWLAATSGNDPRGFPWLPDAPDAPAGANRKLDAFIAYDVDARARVGLQLSYGSSSYRRSPNDNDPLVPTDLGQGGTEPRGEDRVGTQAFSFLLSGGAELGPNVSLDAAFGMTFHRLTYRPNGRANLIDGGGGLEVQGDLRSTIGLTDWWQLVPAMSVRYQGLAASDLADYANGLVYDDSEPGRERYFVTDARLTNFVFDLGVAGHFQPSRRVQVWAAAGFELGRNTQRFEHTVAESPDDGMSRTDQNLEFFRDTLATSGVPYLRLAIEAQVFSWLDFRGGIAKYLRSTEVTEDQVDEQDGNFNRLNRVSRDGAFFDYFLGFALHHQGFFLDLQIDPLWFNRGPELLSGASGSGAGNMFVNTSLGYRF